MKRDSGPGRSHQDKPVCTRIGVLLWVVGAERTLRKGVTVAVLWLDKCGNRH